MKKSSSPHHFRSGKRLIHFLWHTNSQFLHWSASLSHICTRPYSTIVTSQANKKEIVKRNIEYLLPAEIAETDIDELCENEVVHWHDGVVDDNIDGRSSYFDQWR